MPYATKTLVCFLVGTSVWLLKTLLVKVLALSFHVNNFFERIPEALINQYVIETLSGPPIFLERRHMKDKERAFAEVREFPSAWAAMPSELKETLLLMTNCPSSPSCIKRSPTFYFLDTRLRGMTRKSQLTTCIR